MILLLKLGDSFLRLVEYDSDTIYSQYPLTERSRLYSDWQDPNQPHDDSTFNFYSTEMKDLLLLCPSITILNPVQVASNTVQVAPFSQQNRVAKMREFEVILCYQLIQNWPEAVIMNPHYDWPAFLEVEEQAEAFEVREVEKLGSKRDPQRGKILHTLHLFYNGHIRLDNQPLSNEQFRRMYRVFSLIGYQLNRH